MSSDLHVPRLRTSDAGFTLVELLIYISLMVVVLLIVGGMLINSLQVERTVRSSTQATNAGQLVSLSIGQGVRNSSSVWHSASGVVPEVLIVRTVGVRAPANWFCQAWSYEAGKIRTKTSTALIPTDASSIMTWTLLGDGMQQVSGSPVFVKSGRSVTLNLDVSTGTGKPVRISTVSTSRQPVPATGVEVSTPCF